MNVGLRFRPGPLQPGIATYRASDMALGCVCEQVPVRRTVQSAIDTVLRIPDPKWILIADTLSLVFSGPDAHLVSVDAYTNMARWEVCATLPLPVAAGIGAACLAAPPDSDRVDLGVVPRFRYASSEHRLLIDLGRVSTDYYQVCACLILGADDRGIASLIVTDLRLQ